MKRSKNVLMLLAFTITVGLTAQEAQTGTQKEDTSQATAIDTTVKKERIKIDGIASVIGDYVILDSDIEKTLIDIKTQGGATEDITSCQILGKLMEDRLYAHQAVQDSLLVSDDQVNAQSDGQIQGLAGRIGSIEKMLKYYKKPDLESFKAELFEINKLQMLSQKMQAKIVEEIQVTPEEVRQFFYNIPEEERPVFGAELEISQIVKSPKPSEEEKQKVIDRLNGIKQDVEEDGASFNVKAILYSQDPGSKPRGGLYTGVTKNSGYVKEFKDVAFSLREGELSEPFETMFGYHLMKVEKIRGQEVDLRHILMIPEVSDEAMLKASQELDTIRKHIMEGKYTFADGALNFSDEKETKFDGGLLRNPVNFDSKFELTNMDPTLYNQVRELKDGEISRPVKEEDPRGGPPKFKIMQITNRFDEHKADFARDYIKIQELALRDKQFKTIQKWMKEKIEDVYIQVSNEHKDCDFANNWVKN